MKKNFINDSQAEKMCAQTSAEKQRKIKILEKYNKWLREDNDFLEKENEELTLSLINARELAEKQMAITRYIVLVNLMLETLEKTAQDCSPMSSVILSAIFEYKRTISEAMLQFNFDGESLVYAPANKNKDYIEEK